MSRQSRLRRHDRSSMLGRMAISRFPILAAAAGLLALLGGCLPIGGTAAEKPDATVDFNAGWKAVTPCAHEELGKTFSSAPVIMNPNSAQITVFGNYGPSSTIMLVFIQDATPGKARAVIHSHDYMLLWGGPTRQAVAALEKCKNPPPPGTPAPD